MTSNNVFYSELEEAINEVLGSSAQTEEFKRRFKKLIENAFVNNCSNEDIASVLDLITVDEDGAE
jgi:hypothetical protein